MLFRSDALFTGYKKVQIKSSFAGSLANGNKLSGNMFYSEAPEPQDGENILVYNENGVFKAIYQNVLNYYGYGKGMVINMEILRGIDFEIKNSAVSLGKFDGIHLGHRLLLNEVLRHKEFIPSVFTFDISNSINSGREQTAKGRFIYSENEKQTMLKSLGIKRTVIFPFNNETKSMEPEDFIEKILVERMDARFICVGMDFRFGKDRRGTAGMLKAFSSRFGYETKVFNKLSSEDGIISSTLIRKKIEDGDIKRVNELLGRTYFIEGTVVHGNALGRKLDMPTANIFPWEGKVLLPSGVYATTLVLGGRRLPAVTNIGRKPTVGSDRTVVETCILDFKENIYGCDIIVEFHEFLRPEKKFPDIGQLKTQMERDKKHAAEVLKGYTIQGIFGD